MAVLRARDIAKSYGGVTALADGTISVEAGSVHALLGENGAGKSTMVKVLSGAIRPDGGTLTLDGEPVAFRDTADAVRHGVAVVSQELNLFPDLDVLANLYPLREPRRGPFLNRRAMADAARPILKQLGLNVELRTLVRELSLGQRQLVEIARALLSEPRVLVLDEPTSALDRDGSDRLLGILQVLRERQVGVVFVSHILEEVMQLCDTITVLRDGRTVLSGADRADLAIDDIVSAMLGPRPEPSATPVPQIKQAEGELRLDHVAVDGVLDDVDLAVRAGEVVGVAGLAGAGHLAVLELVAGLRRASRGDVRLPGGRPAPRGLRQAIKGGVAVVSGDRRGRGLMLDQPIWQNIGQVRSIGLSRDGVVVRRGALRSRARGHVERLRIRCRDVDQRVGLLSGGNQQKVVLAKWLDASPAVLLLDDPTRGVDVGAKAEIHDLIRGAAADGAVVLLASTDLDELTEVCHRVLVFHRGRIAARLSGDELDQHTIVRVSNTGERQESPR
ncbi:sugar ABC transporter ATP-binding protein [Actinomadura decatromicini]|uniref:Sugar ABC transporter ATP-binding protein n=1 Tax=Actinomadura decatromicini TaxID=2604572 RepID=A0A5D3FYU9_9ACTN|nr:sugar ABC transporter ATP-binding protein [Actinomadura decatromicini]TYK53354.1 sugar ABC transporter ATP-binding protein [Actinomadura decatromicini]